jgi:hypothetical protein
MSIFPKLVGGAQGCPASTRKNNLFNQKIGRFGHFESWKPYLVGYLSNDGLKPIPITNSLVGLT